MSAIVLKSGPSMSPSLFASIRTSVVGLLELFAAAQAVSHAVDNHMRPKAADLRTIGINPEDFPMKF